VIVDADADSVVAALKEAMGRESALIVPVLDALDNITLSSEALVCVFFLHVFFIICFLFYGAGGVGDVGSRRRVAVCMLMMDVYVETYMYAPCLF